MELLGRLLLIVPTLGLWSDYLTDKGFNGIAFWVVLCLVSLSLHEGIRILTRKG